MNIYLVFYWEHLNCVPCAGIVVVMWLLCHPDPAQSSHGCDVYQIPQIAFKLLKAKDGGLCSS